MIRVLIVDDSAFMRKAISNMLEDDPEIQIVGTGRDGIEAVEKAKALKPDVITLDIEMPRLDGISALKQIMKEHPVPILMVSSLTTEGAQATIEAMHAGAVDFIPKQLSYVSLDFLKLKEELVAKVKAVARSRTRLFRRTSASPAPGLHARQDLSLSAPSARIVAIGVSTGGPFSLQKVIPALPEDFHLPVVIVQHMPPHFTKSLADRLDSMSKLHVVEASEGMDLQRGHVYIAPGGRHLVLRRYGARTLLDTPDEPADALHKPCVNVLFESVFKVYGGQALAVVMTGMGRDGLVGAQQLKRAGARIVAQDEETCVVYGMPRAIVEAGLADAVVPLEHLAETIVKATRPGVPLLAKSA